MFTQAALDTLFKPKFIDHSFAQVRNVNLDFLTLPIIKKMTQTNEGQTDWERRHRRAWETLLKVVGRESWNLISRVKCNSLSVIISSNIIKSPTAPWTLTNCQIM